MTDKQREVILAMAKHNMNVTDAAMGLHYHRNSLLYHIERIEMKYGLNPRRFYDLCKLLKMVEELDV